MAFDILTRCMACCFSAGRGGEKVMSCRCSTVMGTVTTTCLHLICLQPVGKKYQVLANSLPTYGLRVRKVVNGFYKYKTIKGRQRKQRCVQQSGWLQEGACKAHNCGRCHAVWTDSVRHCLATQQPTEPIYVSHTACSMQKHHSLRKDRLRRLPLGM